jgi:hypothetical protein
MSHHWVSHDLVNVRLRRHLILVVSPAHVWPKLGIIEIFTSFLNGKKDFTRFVAKFSTLLTETIV